MSTSREAIIAAALRRFLAQGIAATALRQIQHDARVSNGSLFHHFDSKEALAAAVYTECVGRYQRAFLEELDRHDDAETSVRGIVLMHLRWCAEQPETARFLINMTEPTVLRAAEPVLRDLNEHFSSALRSWWKPHAHYGNLRTLTPAQSYALWLGPAQELTRGWLIGFLPEAPNDAEAEMLASVAWLCLRAGP